MIVDHANKTVIHGAKVLSMEELLDFATPEQRFDRIENYIDQLLTLNPKITQGEIYQKLRKQRAYIKKGVVYFDGQSRPLKDFMAEAIDHNNRIEWVEKFKPTTEAERDLLCCIFKVNRPDLVSSRQNGQRTTNQASIAYVKSSRMKQPPPQSEASFEPKVLSFVRRKMLSMPSTSMSMSSST